MEECRIEFPLKPRSVTLNVDMEKTQQKHQQSTRVTLSVGPGSRFHLPMSVVYTRLQGRGVAMSRRISETLSVLFVNKRGHVLITGTEGQARET